MDQQASQTQPIHMLQLLLDTIPTRVFWKDAESFYAGCNRHFAADAGFSSSDIVGKADYDMPWREQAEAYRADDRAVMAGEPRLGYEEPRTIADGRTIQSRISKFPMKDDEGRIIGVVGIYEDVTDHKEAEARLRDRESLCRMLFDYSPFSVALTSTSGEFVDVNEKMLQFLCVTRDEAIGRTPSDLGVIDESTQTEILDAIERAGGRLDEYEVFVQTRGGGNKYALVSNSIVNLKDTPLILTILNDITPRREAQEALRQSEAKYRDLVQNANSIILRWGRDGTIRFFNEFAQRFFGYTEEEVLGRNVMGSIVPDTEISGRDLQAMVAEIAEHPEYHGTNVNENMRKNGDRVWIAWTNKPVFDAHGDITEILSVGLDITARIRDQQALQESEARYRSVFSSDVDAFVLFDSNGCIVDANTRAAELCGCSRNELIGMCSRDIVDPGYYRSFEDFAHINMGEWFQRESRVVRKDGSTFDVEVHGAKLQYGGQSRLLAIIFDITERNKTRESMQLFANIVNSMLAGLCIYRLENPSDDHTLKLTATNPASTTGLALDESEIGKYIDEVFPDLREHGIPERLAEVVRTGEPFNVPDYLFSRTGPPHKHFSFSAFGLPGNQVGVLVENITDLIHAEEDKRRFYRATIEAATEGKLIICDRAEIEQLDGPPIATYEITSREGLSEIRHSIEEFARSEGMDDSKTFDLVLCLGEAATNAIKHATAGRVSIRRTEDALLVVVADSGPGIAAINLPNVALQKGYTTAVSLGMGYKAIISAADRVYLSTGPDGTMVAIEMKLCPADKSLAATILPDKW